MKYFQGITNVEQAKLRYRHLAKQLHPDAGGTVLEFQKMQDEYRITLSRLQECHNPVSSHFSKATPNDFFQGESPEKELLIILGKMAKVLIKKQVPQNYLRRKITTTNSSIKKDVLNEIVDILNEL
ncbi:hypothetical protein [Carboxylicivirga caseinilyticus]|uniref:hypothetical protein n=1 Tax=Carboxylicivirga caseinilyticus TaxID=3417572 RepID=UPI003D35473F|nr:hypothetical protein [Marinilabiliaceae bacterium A049]